jgi:hypothetical protein
MNESEPLFHVWSLGSRDQAPVALPTLVTQVKAGKVHARSWVFSEADGTWRRAADVPELKMFFRRPASGGEAGGIGGITPGTLRRIKILAEMDDAQLEAFLQFVEVVRYRPFTTVVRKLEHGDALFMVLEGELRARTVIDGKESTLSTLGPGDSFGEVAMLDHGPRSADVLANEDSLVLKVSGPAIERMTRELPQCAAPFLLALGKALAGKTRSLTKRFEDTVHLSRAAGNVRPG